VIPFCRVTISTAIAAISLCGCAGAAEKQPMNRFSTERLVLEDFRITNLRVTAL
jgi:hypothetical protein